MLRCVLQLPNGLSQAGASQSILISDSSCDQMLVTSIWRIVSRTRRSVTMNRAFADRGPSQLLPVVSAAAKVIDEQGHIYGAVSHEVLYNDNPLQVESLLSTHQSLSNPSNAIDDQVKEFRQPLQVQSHLEMPGILVQLGHIQRT